MAEKKKPTVAELVAAERLLIENGYELTFPKTVEQRAIDHVKGIYSDDDDFQILDDADVEVLADGAWVSIRVHVPAWVVEGG